VLFPFETSVAPVKNHFKTMSCMLVVSNVNSFLLSFFVFFFKKYTETIR